MDQAVTSDRSAVGRTPSRRRLWVFVSIALVLALAIGAWLLARARTGGAQAGHGTPPPLVTVVLPSLSEVTASVSLTGLISARNDMPIGIEGDPGRIAAVLVEPGDRVRKGQLLARLNPITAQSQVDSALASLEEARANAAVAQAEWARAQRGQDLYSMEDNDRRRTNAVTAQAKVKAAEAQLADARNRLDHTAVLAPTDGIVLTRTAEVGQIAMSGSTVLFHLARDGQIEMRGQVAEQDVPRLSVGQQAQVHLDGVARTFTGTVWQIGAIIDSATRQGSVRIALPAADQDLRPGAFARADIQVGSSRGVILPQTAVLSDEQGTYVLTVDPAGKLERRAVSVAGARSEGLLVSAGLAGTERVVAIAGAFLRTGEVVAIAPPPGAAPSASAGTAAKAAVPATTNALSTP